MYFQVFHGRDGLSGHEFVAEMRVTVEVVVCYVCLVAVVFFVIWSCKRRANQDPAPKTAEYTVIYYVPSKDEYINTGYIQTLWADAKVFQ